MTNGQRDERSTSLFLGYAASAFHLRTQLEQQSIAVSDAQPLLVYIPCGVGGAPAGIAWGLHHVFGSSVHCYFAEPVQAPCFLVQILAAEGEHPSIYDYGLTNLTEADGLAVPRASVCRDDHAAHRRRSFHGEGLDITCPMKQPWQILGRPEAKTIQSSYLLTR